MQLRHAFELPAPVGEVWALLSRLDEVAPCLPGAAAERIDERSYKTTMTVRLGPVQMSYRGELVVAELDAVGRRVVLRAKAAETRGQGSAIARSTAVLTDAGSSTRIELATDLQLTGRVAQMGRGILDDVARHLLDQFVANLSRRFERSRRQTVAAEAVVVEPLAEASGPPESARPAPALSGLRLLLAVVTGRLRQLLSYLRGTASAPSRS